MTTSSLIKVLFVCSGNICRSPTAHGIFENLALTSGLANNFYVDSAGTHCYSAGKGPDKRSARTALDHGIDINSQIARQLVDHDYKEFDYLFGLADQHVSHMQELAPKSARDKIFLFTHPEGIHHGKDVPDPFIGEDGFEEVFMMIDCGCRDIMDWIRARHGI